MSTQQDEVGNPPNSSIWGHVSEDCLLLFAAIFLNKTYGLFLLFHFVFLAIRGRINNSLGIYNNWNMLFLALPTPFSPPLPLYEFLLALMKRIFHA